MILSLLQSLQILLFNFCIGSYHPLSIVNIVAEERKTPYKRSTKLTLFATTEDIIGQHLECVFWPFSLFVLDK